MLPCQCLDGGKNDEREKVSFNSTSMTPYHKLNLQSLTGIDDALLNVLRKR